MKLSKQQERVLEYSKSNVVQDVTDEYFMHGKINAMDSWNKCGVYRLSAVIHDLRKKGIEIITRNKKVKNQFGESCTVGEYIFVGET